MAISFPTSLDNFTNPSSGNTLDSPSHSLQHSDINDAVEAMQRKVGVGTAVAGSASAGQVLTISAAGTSTWSTPSAGKVLQVTQTNSSSTFSSTSTAYPPTAYSFQASITPKSLTSTIYCFATINRYGTSGGGRQFTDIKYNTTSGDSSGTGLGVVSTHADGATDERRNIPAVFMKGVALSSLSTHYFKVVASHGDRDAAATWYINAFSDLSTITLIEVEV